MVMWAAQHGAGCERSGRLVWAGCRCLLPAACCPYTFSARSVPRFHASSQPTRALSALGHLAAPLGRVQALCHTGIATPPCTGLSARSRWPLRECLGLCVCFRRQWSGHRVIKQARNTPLYKEISPSWFPLYRGVYYKLAHMVLQGSRQGYDLTTCGLLGPTCDRHTSV